MPRVRRSSRDPRSLVSRQARCWGATASCIATDRDGASWRALNSEILPWWSSDHRQPRHFLAIVSPRPHSWHEGLAEPVRCIAAVNRYSRVLLYRAPIPLYILTRAPSSLGSCSRMIASSLQFIYLFLSHSSPFFTSPHGPYRV